MYSGQTFGVGQLSPVAALMVTDVVHAKNGLPLLSIDDASAVYQQIMNPDTSVYYMAALIKVEIDTYKRIAGFDISKNPGITATLYNLGNAASRARELKAINDNAQGQGPAAAPAAGEFLRLAGQQQGSRAAAAAVSTLPFTARSASV